MSKVIDYIAYKCKLRAIKDGHEVAGVSPRNAGGDPEEWKQRIHGGMRQEVKALDASGPELHGNELVRLH